MLDISFIQRELAKLDRYIWGRKQDDRWDGLSRFVYGIAAYDQVMKEAHRVAVENKIQPQAFVGYCLNRWFNFWSTKVVEELFCQHPDVIREPDAYHKEIDFYIRGTPFDHKTSVFPHQYAKGIDYAVKHRKDLIRWQYYNQSKEGRFHLSNRIFVVVYDRSDPSNSWKLKADFHRIKRTLFRYLDSRSPFRQVELEWRGQRYRPFTDVLFVLKGSREIQSANC